MCANGKLERNDESVKLDRGDVFVMPLPNRLCEECDLLPATHVVYVDFRMAGFKQIVTKACEPCAVRLAERIRDGLPDGNIPNSETGA